MDDTGELEKIKWQIAQMFHLLNEIKYLLLEKANE
jgi:hypothetical protein